jgi:hypothetical protein
MAHEAFTAGVGFGGLTTDYEIRMLVCWLLYQIQVPVKMSQLNAALQRDALVNYFELAMATGNLLSTGHIKEAKHPEKTEPPLLLTPLGEQMALTFEKNLPLSLREKSLAALRQVLARERFEKENVVEIAKTDGGYRMTLQISDTPNDLMDLTLYVPTEELCSIMKDRFLNDPGALYRVVADYLTGGAFSG